MKVLMLAAGRGKRLGAVSEGANKCLLEFAGKPLIEYSLEAACKLKQVSEIIMVVGYRSEDILSRYGKRYQGKNIRYVFQGEQLGLVHAIACAAETLAGDDFMLMLGDEFMVNPHHPEFLEAFGRENVFALCGVITVADKELIKKTYGVIQGEGGRVIRLIEKPAYPPDHTMGTGNCIFKNKILEYIPHTPINQKRREKELPDLIQCAIDDNHTVRIFPICREYVNVNTPQDLIRGKSYFSHL